MTLTFSTIRMQRMLRSKIHKKSSPSLRKPKRLVLNRNDISIHRRFDPVREIPTPAAARTVPTMQYIKHALFAFDYPKPVRRAARIQHPVASLDARTYSNRRRPLKYRLRSLVILIPRLNRRPKEQPNPPDVHLPSRIKSFIIDIRQNPNRR